MAGHLICINITETLTAPEQKSGVHRNYWTICFRVSWSPPRSNAHLSTIKIVQMWNLLLSVAPKRMCVPCFFLHSILSSVYMLWIGLCTLSPKLAK